MMISPEAYINEFKNATYTELIIERKRLTEYIDLYESGNHISRQLCTCPSPDVKYQCYLEYLSILCSYMQRRYNEDYTES